MAIARALLVLVAVTSVAACDKLKDSLPWQSFSIVSTSMEPTLRQGSYVTGVSVDRADLRRGDILIVRSPRAEKYVVRLAGLPGDRISMVDGRVVLDGKAIALQPAGTWKLSDPEADLAMYFEHFPGERGRHRILDDGVSPGDDFPEIVLGEDRYFLLGDNRDHAADSRYSGDFMGLGLVRGQDILRRISLD